MGQCGPRVRGESVAMLNKDRRQLVQIQQSPCRWTVSCHWSVIEPVFPLQHCNGGQTILAKLLVTEPVFPLQHCKGGQTILANLSRSL